MSSFLPNPLTAVILAAGLGARARGFHQEPKGLIPVAGVTLLQRTLDVLRAAGVGDLVLVTGYREEAYRDFLAGREPGVRVVHNPDFFRTGSMHSLWLARESVPGDLLVIESDLLFEARAIAALLAAPPGPAVLLSGPTGQGDEVYALAAGGRLLALTKRRPAEPAPIGEYVGIARLTAEFFAALCRHYAADVAFPSPYHYDDGLTALARSHAIQCISVPDLIWAEIDDEAQYLRALRDVLPALGSR